jgi:hypothetical protein
MTHPTAIAAPRRVNAPPISSARFTIGFAAMATDRQELWSSVTPQSALRDPFSLYNKGSDSRLADNLALLCHHHHFLKTFEGWTLTRADSGGTDMPEWRFEPEPPSDRSRGSGSTSRTAEAIHRHQQQAPKAIADASLFGARSELRSPPTHIGGAERVLSDCQRQHRRRREAGRGSRAAVTIRPGQRFRVHRHTTSGISFPEPDEPCRSRPLSRGMSLRRRR